MKSHVGPTNEFDSREAAASFVATYTLELAVVARAHGLDTLGYLLEMARLEAENFARPPRRQG
jgi:hypothetical protein